MSGIDQTRLEAVFQAAADLPTGERGRFLDRECAGDGALRTEVEALLAEHDRGTRGVLMALEATAAEPLPDRIGHYRIIRLLGRGGMGAVYEAEQDNPRRTVALKAIHAGFAPDNAVKRFEQEAHVLGQLKHPGIAQIYEAGTIAGAHGGQPYFALELVRGRSLTEHAAARGLGVRERLELVGAICDAVQHSHERGVVHRDLKPANILVEEGSGPGRPKVLDFGIARAMDSDLRRVTMNTGVGQLLGTLPYMSPEQVSGDPTQVDAGTDVYSLGVILYELLAGRLPHDLTGRPIPEAVRIIRDDEPTSLTTHDRRLAGDVATIVGKAMAKEKERRYQSAAELGADIARYLHDEPISARPPTTMYQLRKFARRNRALVGGVLATIVTLTAGVVVASVLYLREAEQHRHADLATAGAESLAYRASIGAAAAALQSYASASARRSLDEAPVALRGWEWRHLDRRCDQSVLTLPGTKDGARCVAISNDGRSILAGEESGRILVRDLVTGMLLQTVEAGGAVHEVVAGPGGTVLARTGTAHEVGLWECSTGRRLWGVPGAGALGEGAFRHDGRAVAIGLENSFRISLLDSTTGAVVGTVPVSSPTALHAAFTGDGARLIMYADGRTQVVDGSTGEVVVRTDLFYPATDLRSRWITGLGGQGVVAADQATGKIAGSMAALTGRALCYTPSPNDRHLAIGESSGLVVVRDCATGAVVSTHHGHRAAVRDLAYSPDGTRLVSASSDGEIRVWEDPDEPTPFTVPPSTDGVGSAAFAPGARALVTTGWGAVRAWDTASGAERWTRVISRVGSAVLIAISPDGRRIGVAGWDDRITVLDAETGGDVATIPQPTSGVRAMDWLSAERLIVASTTDDLRVLDAASGAVMARAPTAPGPAIGLSALAVAPGGRRVAAGGEDGAIRLWDQSLVGPIWTAAAHGATVRCCAFSADGLRLASGGADGTVHVTDVLTGRHVAGVSDLGAVNALAFSPDGARLGAACADGQLHVLNGADDLLVVPTASTSLLAAAFSEDGLTLLGSGAYTPMVAFESVLPTTALRMTRRNVRSARVVVDGLFHTLALSQDIVEHIRSDSDLAPDVRQAAIDMAKARGDQVNWLNNDAWGVVLNARRSAEEYRLAVRRAELACRLWPDNHSLLNTLGAAQYRAGDFEAAIATLSRCDELSRAGTGKSHPMDWAFLAMAHHRLGNTDAAREDLQRLRELATDPQFAGDSEVQGFLREAETVLGTR